MGSGLQDRPRPTPSRTKNTEHNQSRHQRFGHGKVSKPSLEQKLKNMI